MVHTNALPASVRLVAGADVAYNEATKQTVGALVVLDANTLAVVDSATHVMPIPFPYVPGLFSFREVPPLLEAWKKLQHHPDLIVCDGQGIAHPNAAGMASHLGVELDVPTIGCAKSRLVGEVNPDHLGEIRGSTQPLMLDGEAIGALLRTQTRINPLYVSIGHKVDLATAVEWVLRLSPQYRLPETTRQADQLVNAVMNEL